MAKVPLREVRWLTLDELSKRWALELHERQDFLLRELRLGVINLARLERGEGLIPELPPEHEWPPIDRLVTRDWVDRFCAKQRWQRPRFWFQDAPVGRRRGAPGYRNWKHIEQELERRIQLGEAKESWRAESNYLVDWIAHVFPGEQPPQAKTIRNRLGEFRANLMPARN